MSNYTPEQLATELIEAASVQTELSKELRLTTMALLASQGRVRELEGELAELKKSDKPGRLSEPPLARPDRFRDSGISGL